MSEYAVGPQPTSREVSVIIPFYNGSKFIERALKSVEAQVCAPLEIIVVNDGSSEDELAKLEAFQSTYSFILLSKANGGQSSARNFGVNKARGRYIAFLDQDDFFMVNHLKDLCAAIPDDPGFGAVYGDVCIADNEGRIIERQFLAGKGDHPKRRLVDLLKQDMYILPSATVICRNAFDAVGGFDERLCGYEDDDLFLRMFALRFNIIFINNEVLFWCIRTDSTSYSMTMSRSRFYYFNKICDNNPDVPTLNRFYLNAVIIPRFLKHFIIEYIDAVRTNDTNAVELRGFALEAIRRALSTKEVHLWPQTKLRFWRTLFTAPPFFVKLWCLLTLRGLHFY